MAAATATSANLKELARQLRESPRLLNVLLHELAAKTRSKVLLFVDQLEEVFTLVAEDEVRRRFVEAVCKAVEEPASPVRAVFTVRDDFLGRVMAGTEVGTALDRVVVLRRPGKAELSEMLGRPMAMAGYRFEDPVLLEEMAASVEGEPACLPLVQFAAQLLWEKRDKTRRLIPRSAYQEMGGIPGALAEHADSVLAGLGSEQVQVARELLLALVTPEGTRRVVAMRGVEASQGSAGKAVLGRLAQARLVTIRRGRIGETIDTVAELAHESLIHTWGQLARWLEESKEDREFLVEVQQAAEQWERRGRRDEELWQGQILDENLARLQRCQCSVPELARHFLTGGLARKQRWRQRRRIAMAVGVSLLALVAVVSTVREREVRRQRDQAVAQRAEAQAQRAEAQREGASAALNRGDLLEARAKLRGSLETRDSTMGRVLWGELLQQSLLWSKKLGGWVWDVAFFPDGRTVAGACVDGKIYLVDTGTTMLRTLRSVVGPLWSVAVSPRGDYLAAGSESGRIVLWSVEHGRALELSGHTATVWGLTFDAAGESLASASNDTTVRVWDVGSGRERLVLRGHDKPGTPVTRVAFTREGALFSAGRDGTVRKWDPRTGVGRILLEGADSLYGLAVDPAGRRLATGGAARTIRLWQADGENELVARELAAMRGHRDLITGIAISTDGRFL
ncbi:MAG: WD40 repeat domain-containing protein, partial [Pseudomonadota bacterium]